MPSRIVVDSGPLIALFTPEDQHHAQAMRFVQTARAVLTSNWAVVTEVTHLLSFHLHAPLNFLTWIQRGGIELIESDIGDLTRIIELMRKYADLPMDFADASLVALCERLDVRDIASVDRDFRVYRFRGRQSFRNVFFE